MFKQKQNPMKIKSYSLRSCKLIDAYKLHFPVPKEY